MTWWGVINPGARGTSIDPDRVSSVLSDVGVVAELHTSSSPDDLRQIVTRGVSGGFDKFLVVGGDGTVNLTVNALIDGEPRPDLTIGVLPTGSGCDLIRTFGISQTLEEAATHLAGDDTYAIDIGYLDGPWGRRYFANVASVGLGAAVVRYANRLPAWLGGSRYKLAIWPALAFFRKSRIQLQADSRQLDGEASLIVLANAQFFGGGMNIAPKASTVDGLFDVQVFTGPKRNAVVLQHRVTRGTHLTHKAVRRLIGAEVSLSTARHWEVEADGEYLGTATTLSAGMLRGALALKI